MPCCCEKHIKLTLLLPRANPQDYENLLLAQKADLMHEQRMTEANFHTMPDGTRLAYRFTPGSGPTIVFLPGYMSDMAGGKATAVFDWAAENGRACLLLDYSGCGESDGDFADGTLSRWRDEVLTLIEAVCDGPVLLAGSSMGGWLMLMIALTPRSRS